MDAKPGGNTPERVLDVRVTFFRKMALLLTEVSILRK